MPNLYPVVPVASVSAPPPKRIRRRLFPADTPVDAALFPDPPMSAPKQPGRSIMSSGKRERKRDRNETISAGQIYALSPYGMNIYQFVRITGFTPTGRPRAVLLHKLMAQGPNWNWFVAPGPAIEDAHYTFSLPTGGSIRIGLVRYYLTDGCEYNPLRVYTDRPPL